MARQGLWVGMLAVLVLAGCKRDAEPVAGVSPDTAAPAPEAATGADRPPRLDDVIETNSRYIIGISYPPAAARYPGLARELVAYAEAARAELLQSLESLGNDSPTAPYELSLSFELPVDSARIVAATADGSRYTGGAHGEPLVARFVWLPQSEEMLRAERLVPDAEGWQVVGEYIAGHLRQDVAQRARSEGLDETGQREMVREASRMIEEGTAAEAANFSQFQPLLGADGRVSAIRFVFPPYQVGPYSDGTQTVDVPAAVLLPYVAPEYRELFAAR